VKGCDFLSLPQVVVHVKPLGPQHPMTTQIPPSRTPPQYPSCPPTQVPQHMQTNCTYRLNEHVSQPFPTAQLHALTRTRSLATALRNRTAINTSSDASCLFHANVRSSTPGSRSCQRTCARYCNVHVLRNPTAAIDLPYRKMPILVRVITHYCKCNGK
jgi:hypothetical protein